MKSDWTFCNGLGQLDGTPSNAEPVPKPQSKIQNPKSKISRRSTLAIGIGLLGFLANRRSALAQAAFSKNAEDKDLLVVIFLRGGADGLSLVPPFGEDAYHRARPNLGLGSPKGSASLADRAIDLDGFFGLHPALGPLLPSFRDGHLAIAHAVGSADQSRSHFEAMSAMERGLPNAVSGAASGWLARYLTQTQADGDSPLRAVALGPILPDSLRGGVTGSAIQTISDFKLGGETASAMRFEKLLKVAYADGQDDALRAGQNTLKILDAISKLDPQAYKGSSSYPQSDIGEGLKQVAMLSKAGVGLEVACLDKGGWDTHVAQGASTGWLSGLLDDLSKAMVAFSADMGPRMARTTVVVMTEFGRRAYENSGLGTDHGRGSVMFLMGGSVKGGKVYADWPGLEEHQLEPPGDLRVTTDYRQILAETLHRRMRFEDPGQLFDGLSYRPSNLLA